MIIFIYGTTAEAIKLAPIARRLDAAGIRYQQWVTMQHTDALQKIIPQLGLPTPDIVIANGRRGKPLRNVADVLVWLVSVQSWVTRNVWRLRRTIPRDSVVVIHGDTMTSVLGAYIARCIGVPSAHVEAGLRSGNLRHPFPEEIDRRLVGKLARIHYAPSLAAAANLSKRKHVVHTYGNTVIDAVLDHAQTAGQAPSEYGVVLLHRFEFISNDKLVSETIKALISSSPHSLRFVVDAYAESTISSALRMHEGARVELLTKLRHEDFITLLNGAQFVVTDSGGIQEEVALLGVPTLIHRVATERDEGVGRNVVLSGWHTESISDFLATYDSYRYPLTAPEKSPSDTIVNDLISRGYGSKSAP